MTEISDKAVEAAVAGYEAIFVERALPSVREALRAALSAALPHLGAAGVAVRELEWKPESRSYQTAWTSIGIVYGITEFEEIRSPFMLSSATMTDYPHFATLDAAKAAAQADFNQRIRSALVPSSVPQDAAAEPVAWLANCCQCGRVVDTREQSEEAGDPFGAETTPGRWTCSFECWELEVEGITRADLKPASPPSHDAELLAARELLRHGRQKLATYVDIYAGDKELRRLLAEWDAALAPAASQEGR